MWWEHWFDKTMSQKVDALVVSGSVTVREGRLSLNTALLTKPFWLHIPGTFSGRNCALWYEIFFGKLNVIHSFCRYKCWKCVTRPRNVRELIQTFNLMYVVPFVYNLINPIPGKAGLDVRSHTSKPYGVFQYGNSLKEALRIKEIMIYMIRTYLPNEEIDGQHLEDTVFVKRSCTEFEEAIPGDDPWWDTPQTEDEIAIEQKLEDMFHKKMEMTVQPNWLRDKTLHFWLSQANSIGDTSAVDFIGNDIFNVRSKEYKAANLLQGGDPASDALESAEEHPNKEINHGDSD